MAQMFWPLRKSSLLIHSRSGNGGCWRRRKDTDEKKGRRKRQQDFGYFSAKAMNISELAHKTEEVTQH